MKKSESYSISAAAAMLGLSYEAVLELVEARQIPAKKDYKNRWRIKKKDIHGLLSAKNAEKGA